MVAVAQDVIIRDTDCHTEKCIRMKSISNGEKSIVPLADRLLGRTIAEDIIGEDGKVLVKSGIKRTFRIDLRFRIWGLSKMLRLGDDNSKNG